jgi:hypothetical protein
MPAEQRVITAGFVVVALIIVVVLFVVIPDKGTTDTLDDIRGDYFPAYLKAEERSDYKDMRASAEQILAAVDEGGRATIIKNLQALATDQDRKILRLYKMVEEGEFEKNVKGEFQFEGEFYPTSVHRGLSGLRAMMREEFGTLRRARDLAESVKNALEEARTGSGNPLLTPSAIDVKGAMPEVDPNPILDHDSKLFAVFALDPDLLIAALGTKDPGGRATSARLRWNRDVPASSLTEDLKKLPPQIARMGEVAAKFGAYSAEVEKHPNGPKAAAALYAKACDAIANGMDRSVRAEFEKHRKAYEKGPVINRLLQAEVQLLNAGKTRLSQLADAFQLKFK